MKDMFGNEIIENCEVVCEDPIEGCLSKNKKYLIKALRPDEGRVVLIPDDRGLEGHYKSSRFRVLNPKSNQEG